MTTTMHNHVTTKIISVTPLHNIIIGISNFQTLNYIIRDNDAVCMGTYMYMYIHVPNII